MSKELWDAFQTGLLLNCKANVKGHCELSIGLDRKIGSLRKEPIPHSSLPMHFCGGKACRHQPRHLRHR